MLLSFVRLARSSQICRTNVPSLTSEHFFSNRCHRSLSVATVRNFGCSKVLETIPQKQGLVDSTPTKKPGFLSNMFKKIFSEHKYSPVTLKKAGYNLNAQCTEKVNFEDFLTTFDMPDTYYSWFQVTEIHVWMMSVRLMVGETAEGERVRKELIEALWVDCDGRVKAIGGIPFSEKKTQLNEISQEFMAALLIYDLGILGDDKALSNAVWRRFFLASDPDFEKIEILVRYIRRNMALLDSISLEDLIMKSDVRWESLL